METYRITALKMGTLVSDKGGLTRCTDAGTSIEIPIWALAVEAKDFRMVVDTGIHSVAWVEEHICPCRREEDESIEGALAHIGWKPDDVDVVVNTHLHYDHTGGNALFRNAYFYVQKAEWEAAGYPLPNQSMYYLNELFDSRAAAGTRLRLLDGEYRLADGIVLISTPGHSAGHQSVLINTEEGVVCFSGDAANLLENITADIVPNILVDSVAAYKSLEDIRRKAEFVIPGHEPAIAKYQTSGFLKIHE